MKVIIAGSRGITDEGLVFKVIDESGFHITEVVCGDARGVDALGNRWAMKHRVPVKHFPADWDNLGKRAGYVRNSDMADYADALVCVWDGESKGSMHMISIASKKGLPSYIHSTG